MDAANVAEAVNIMQEPAWLKYIPLLIFFLMFGGFAWFGVISHRSDF